jgi:hypothetical protein
MATSLAFTSAGTTLSIGAAPGTLNQAGYEAVSWVEIAEITDLGEVGKEYNLVTHNPVGNRQTFKRRGSFNTGQMTVQMARAPSDAGQADLIDGLESDDSVAFKMVLQDGTTLYFTAQIMSYKTSVGSVDSITSATVTLEIDSDIVEVVAP